MTTFCIIAILVAAVLLVLAPFWLPNPYEDRFNDRRKEREDHCHTEPDEEP